MPTAQTAPSTEALEDRGAPSSAPPYGWAVGAGLAVFLLYALTLARTTAFWDTSEYIATGHILGIPHPPGNPTFVLLARTWDILLSVFGLSTAVRINLFSAFMSATAHALWFLVVHHILRSFSQDRVFRLAGAAAAVLVSATAFTVWNQSDVNEKVYTVSLMTIALLSWLLFRWQERLGQGKDDNLVVLMVFILALSVGNHLMAFLAAPAMLVFVLLVNPRTLMNWKLYAAAAVAGLIGLTVHLILPLRAGLDPVINEAAPTCPTVGAALVSIVTWGKAGCVALSDALARRQYDKPPILPRLSPFVEQIENYFQYFDWQWSRALQGTNVLFALARLPFTLLFTGLGLWGAMEHARRDRASFFYVLALFGTLSFGLVWYLNFKYGFSIASPTPGLEGHEVRERDYFFVVSFSVWALWVGVGLAALWQTLAERAGSFARAAPVLAIGVIPLALNWSWAARSRDWAARDWGYNLLMSVEPYGILFTNGDNDTFPLWYEQEVEGVRRDVTVIVTSYLNTAWYTKQLRDITRPCPAGVSADQDWTRILCQRPYDTSARAVYAADGETLPAGTIRIPLDAPVRAPDKPIHDLDDATIDKAAQSYIPMDQARGLTIGNVEALIPGGQYLYPWHQFALTILTQSIATRPIYFASSGNAAVDLGVQPYLIRHGLAFKLNNGPTETSAPAGTIRISPDDPIRNVTGPAVGVPRTQVLLDSVFVHHSGLPAWDHWPDHSTIGIPNYYAWAYYGVAQAFAQTRRTDQVVNKYKVLGDRWAELGKGQ